MNFYKPIFIENRKRIVASKFKLVRLGAISTKITKGETPLWKGDEYQEKGILFVKSENVLTGSLFLSKSVFIDDDVHQRMRRSQLKKGDVLLNIVGASIGRSCVYDRSEAANINQAVCLIRPSKDVNPHWLCTVLNSEPFQTVLDQIKSGGARDNIDLYQVRALKVPFSPPDIQNHIVEIMQSAYAQKRQKDQEADALLDSIDDYVLSKLGVELPKPNNNRIENRIFTATFSDVSGRRLDPEVYSQVYALYTKSYPMEVLQDCVLINPQTSFYGYVLDTSITFVPMEKVSARYGEANLSLCKVIREAQGYTKFREDDLIWAKITPCMENGKSAVVDNLKGGIGVGSTEFHVFRALEGINIHYIHALLRLKSLREHAVLHFTGSAGQQRVPSAFFKELIIPKPPIEKQTQIANHIAEIRNHAKQLQQEADAIVERAKREVERILLEGVSD